MSVYNTTYSSRGVLITYAGLDLKSGKGEDTFFTMEYTSDRFSATVGASGDVSPSISPDQSGKITLTYQAASQSCKLLVALHGALRASELAGKPILGAVPLGIVDPSGTTLVVAAQAAMMSVGTNTLGLGENTRDFVFHVPSMVETAFDEAMEQQIDTILGDMV
jgi:hypothetical protein